MVEQNRTRKPKKPTKANRKTETKKEPHGLRLRFLKTEILGLFLVLENIEIDKKQTEMIYMKYIYSVKFLCIYLGII